MYAYEHVFTVDVEMTKKIKTTILQNCIVHVQCNIHFCILSQLLSAGSWSKLIFENYSQPYVTIPI